MAMQQRSGCLLDRDIDLLERGGQDVVAKVALIRVHADPVIAVRLRRPQRPEATSACDLEDDLAARCDLVIGDRLAV